MSALSAVQLRYVSLMLDVSVHVKGFQSDSDPSHALVSSATAAPLDVSEADAMLCEVTVTRTSPSNPHECWRVRDTAYDKQHARQMTSLHYSIQLYIPSIIEIKGIRFEFRSQSC